MTLVVKISPAIVEQCLLLAADDRKSGTGKPTVIFFYSRGLRTRSATEWSLLRAALYRLTNTIQSTLIKSTIKTVIGVLF